MATLRERRTVSLHEEGYYRHLDDPAADELSAHRFRSRHLTVDDLAPLPADCFSVERCLAKRTKNVCCESSSIFMGLSVVIAY